MSRLVLLLSLTLFVSINLSKTAATPQATYQNYNSYIQRACNSTTYPTLCYNSLSNYSSTIKSDPIKLCTTALSLNAKSAKKATYIVSTLLKKARSTSRRDVPILKDCLEEMKDTVDELKDSYNEMKKISLGGEESVQECLKNVRTWVSSALTDEGTCTDELDEGEVNVAMKKKVKKAASDLSKITSITLSLVTKYPSY